MTGLDATRLLLLAQDAVELPLLSSLVQDATLRPCHIDWDARAHRLVALIGRYRWEAHDNSRIRTALRIDHVLRAERRNWPADPDNAMLALLAITLEGDRLTLAFSGGTTLRLTIEVVDVTLEDLTAPWPAMRQPEHEA